MSFFQIENIKTMTNGRWLRRPDAHALREPLSGIGIDTRSNLDNRAYVAIRGEHHDGHSFLHEAAQGGARLLIVERKPDRMPLPLGVGVLCVDDARRALARLALAYRRTLTATKVIAVTGSCGKTTTKRMIDGVLSAHLCGSSALRSFNNDIGVPLTILAASPRDRYVVVEIGTNAPGEIGRLASIAEPDVAVITSIGRAHLERLGSIEGVAREKSSLLAHLRRDGTAILTADSPDLRGYVKLAPSVILFGEAPDGDLRLTARGRCDDGGTWWLEINGRSRFNVGLPGRHNALNAIAAIAVARRMGIADDHISAALAKVRPEEMRLCRGRIGGIDVFNDAYNANPDSMAAALETFAELAGDAPRRIVILGDMLELGSAGPQLHAEVGRKIIEIDRRARIDHAILVGPLSSHAAVVLRKEWAADRITLVKEIGPDAPRAIADRLRPGDAVLIKASRGLALERVTEHLRRRSEALTV